MKHKKYKSFNYSESRHYYYKYFDFTNVYRNLQKEPPEFKSILRVDMKDDVEYDDARLNVASKFEGMDELFNIEFTMSEEALERMGDRDFFSLSMNNVNNGVEYGNVRAFFKTQVT